MEGLGGQSFSATAERAIFGFQILILKQIRFDSSATGQIPSGVDCRVWST